MARQQQQSFIVSMADQDGAMYDLSDEAHALLMGTMNESANEEPPAVIYASDGPQDLLQQLAFGGGAATTEDQMDTTAALISKYDVLDEAEARNTLIDAGGAADGTVISDDSAVYAAMQPQPQVQQPQVQQPQVQQPQVQQPQVQQPQDQSIVPDSIVSNAMALADAYPKKPTVQRYVMPAHAVQQNSTDAAQLVQSSMGQANARHAYDQERLRLHQQQVHHQKLQQQNDHFQRLQHQFKHEQQQQANIQQQVNLQKLANFQQQADMQQQAGFQQQVSMQQTGMHNKLVTGNNTVVSGNMSSMISRPQQHQPGAMHAQFIPRDHHGQTTHGVVGNCGVVGSTRPQGHGHRQNATMPHLAAATMHQPPGHGMVVQRPVLNANAIRHTTQRMPTAMASPDRNPRFNHPNSASNAIQTLVTHHAASSRQAPPSRLQQHLQQAASSPTLATHEPAPLQPASQQPTTVQQQASSESKSINVPLVHIPNIDEYQMRMSNDPTVNSIDRRFFDNQRPYLLISFRDGSHKAFSEPDTIATVTGVPKKTKKEPKRTRAPKGTRAPANKRSKTQGQTRFEAGIAALDAKPMQQPDTSQSFLQHLQKTLDSNTQVNALQNTLQNSHAMGTAAAMGNAMDSMQQGLTRSNQMPSTSVAGTCGAMGQVAVGSQNSQPRGIGANNIRGVALQNRGQPKRSVVPKTKTPETIKSEQRIQQILSSIPTRDVSHIQPAKNSQIQTPTVMSTMVQNAGGAGTISAPSSTHYPAASSSSHGHVQSLANNMAGQVLVATSGQTSVPQGLVQQQPLLVVNNRGQVIHTNRSAPSAGGAQLQQVVSTVSQLVNSQHQQNQSHLQSQHRLGSTLVSSANAAQESHMTNVSSDITQPQHDITALKRPTPPPPVPGGAASSEPQVLVQSVGSTTIQLPPGVDKLVTGQQYKIQCGNTSYMATYDGTNLVTPVTTSTGTATSTTTTGGDGTLLQQTLQQTQQQQQLQASEESYTESSLSGGGKNRQKKVVVGASSTDPPNVGRRWLHSAFGKEQLARRGIHEGTQRKRPKFEPGKFALCSNCGYLSENYICCDGCNKDIHGDPKYIYKPVTTGTTTTTTSSLTLDKNKFYSKNSTTSADAKKVTVTTLIHANVTPDANKSTRGGRRKKPVPIETVTILSSDEDDNASDKTDSTSASAAVHHNTPQVGKTAQAVADLLNKTPKLGLRGYNSMTTTTGEGTTTTDTTVTIATGDNSAKVDTSSTATSTAFGTNNSTNSKSSVMLPGRKLRMEDESGNTLGVALAKGAGNKKRVIFASHSIRIGTQRITPVGHVEFNDEYIKFQISYETQQILLSIQTNEIQSIAYNLNISVNVMFLYLRPAGAAQIRNALKMSREKGFYYDPASKDEAEKCITIFTEVLSKPQKDGLLSLFQHKVNGQVTCNAVLDNMATQILMASAKSIQETSVTGRPGISATKAGAVNVMRPVQNAGTRGAEQDGALTNTKGKGVTLQQQKMVINKVCLMNGTSAVVTTMADGGTAAADGAEKTKTVDSEDEDMGDRSRSPSPPHNVFSGPIVKLCVYPPPPTKGGISVTNEDLFCMNEGEFLNDVIIDFYLKYIYYEHLSEEDQRRTHIFSSFFYRRLTQKVKNNVQDEDTKQPIAKRRHSRVCRWTRQVDLFSKDFIIVPINESAHWYLAIICFPNLKAISEEKMSAAAASADEVTTAASASSKTARGKRAGGKKGRGGTAAVLAAGVAALNSLPADAQMDRNAKKGTDNGDAANNADKQVDMSQSEAAAMPQSKLAETSQSEPAATSQSDPAATSNSDVAAMSQSEPAATSQSETATVSQSGEASQSSSDNSTANASQTSPTAAHNSATDDITGTSKTENNDKTSSETTAEKAAADSTTSDKDESKSTKIVHKRPLIMIFDSLAGTTRGSVMRTLRDYLQIEWNLKKASKEGDLVFDKFTLQGVTPACPQQTNYSDCGIYVLQYVDSFFKDPITNFSLPMKDQLANWFSDDLMKNKRTEIKQLILALMHMQKPDLNYDPSNDLS